MLLEVYPAGEAAIKDADGRSLARSIRGRGRVDPVFVESLDELDATVANLLEDGDVFVTLGADTAGAEGNENIAVLQHGFDNLVEPVEGFDEYRVDLAAAANGTRQRAAVGILDMALAGRVNLEQNQLIDLGQYLGKILEQVARARITVRLE